MPKGQSPNSRRNITPTARNSADRLRHDPKHQAEAGRASGAARTAKRERQDKVKEAAKVGDPLTVLEAVFAEAGDSLQRMMREMNKAGSEPTPVLTQFMDKTRLLINDCISYRRELQSDLPAKQIAAELAKRWEAANWSELSPDVPEMPEETYTPATTPAPDLPSVELMGVPLDDPPPEPEDDPEEPPTQVKRAVCPICADSGAVSIEGEAFACPRGPHKGGR